MLARRTRSPSVPGSSWHSGAALLRAFLARLVVVLIAVGLLAAAGRLFAQAFALADGDLISFWGLHVTLDTLDLPLSTRLTWAGLAVGGAILGLSLLWVGLGGFGRSNRAFVLSRRSDGIRGASRVTLSERAVRMLVAEAADHAEGVWESYPEVTLRRGGWDVRVTIFLRRDAVVTETAERVEHAVAESLKNHTGIAVRRFRVRTELGPYEGAKGLE